VKGRDFAVSWIIQDAIATSLMLGAIAVLARRIVAVVRPPRGETACGACGSCAPGPAASAAAGSTVPLRAIRGKAKALQPAAPRHS
jgi:hypothetical protein